MGDRLASIVRGILKDKFIRAIGERKWTAQDEESINKLSDFFTEFDQRIAALERAGETRSEWKDTPTELVCPECRCNIKAIGHTIPCSWPKPPATVVEKYSAFKFIRSIDPICPYAGHHNKIPIGEVVATPINHCGCTSWSVQLPSQPVDNAPLILSPGEYRALVEHNTKAGIWERQG